MKFLFLSPENVSFYDFYICHFVSQYKTTKYKNRDKHFHQFITEIYMFVHFLHLCAIEMYLIMLHLKYVC